MRYKRVGKQKRNKTPKKNIFWFFNHQKKQRQVMQKRRLVSANKKPAQNQKKWGQAATYPRV
jgi:hypothetical protein